jgi:hypothetical protein
MAKVTLNSVLESISGKVGGVVFRSSGSGIQLSAKPSKRAVSIGGSALQSVYLSTDSAAWNYLTSLQRKAWENVADLTSLSVRMLWLWSRSWFRATEGLTTWPLSSLNGGFSYGACACYSPAYHIFVFVYDNYRNGGFYSPDGYHWTAFSTPQTSTWRCVKVFAEAGKFVAVSSDGTKRVMTSWDGITWQLRDASSASSWMYLNYATDLNQWCAVANSGTYRVMTSPDGVTWTNRTLPVTQSLWCIARSPELGLWVALGSGTSNQVSVSADGVTWSAYSTPEQTAFRDVVWAKELGMFCAVSAYGSKVFYRSYDGINWVGSGGAPAGSVSRITWSSGLHMFCASFGSGSYQVATSFNGITWTKQTVASSLPCGAVLWSDWHAMFVAFSYGVTLKSVTSPITLEPTASDGSPLLLGFSDKEWTGETQTPIYTMAAPLVKDIAWTVVYSGGKTYLTFSMSGELQSGAAQNYIEIFVSRPMNNAEEKYNGSYMRAGIVRIESAPFTSENIEYPWMIPLTAGRKLSFRLRYVSRGCRLSPSVNYTTTIN